MHSQDKGDLSKSAIIFKLMKLGYKIAEPIGENNRFDLIIYKKDLKFKTVQCKTGKIINNAVKIPLASIVKNFKTKKWERRNYKNEIDFICAYSPEIDKCYMIDEKSIGKSILTLRIEKPKNNRSFIKWAKNYEI